MEKAKYIYETVVEKSIDDKVIEKRQEDGKEIEVSIPIKTRKSIKIAILKPDRKKYKDAEIFYAKKLSYYLKEGLLPSALVQKRYANDGGPLSDGDKDSIKEMRENYTVLQKEYFDMKEPISDIQKTRRAAILLEMTEINNRLSEIQNNYAGIFENTAEAKANNDRLDWWILNLGLIWNDEKKAYEQFFGEGDTESKLKKLEEIDNKNDDFLNEVLAKLSYFISFWFTTGLDVKEEDFKSAEDHYNINVTKYLKIEGESPKESSKEEVKSTEQPKTV